MVLTIVVIILMFIKATRAAYHCADCKHYKSWEVDYSNNTADSTDLQNYFYLFQNSLERCKQFPLDKNTKAGGGLGHGYAVSFPKYFFLALESGRSMRPVSDWLWADKEFFNCTLGIHSIDCYNDPIGFCGVPGYENQLIKDVNYSSTRIGRLLGSENPDICNIGLKLKKPLIWVYAQVITYLTQFRQDVALAIKKRYDQAFSKNVKGGLTLAAHYRTGQLDRGRWVVGLNDFIRVLDTKISEEGLKSIDNNVTMVYLASHIHDNTTFTSTEQMTRDYPNRPYDFSILPIMNVVSHNDSIQELEYMLKAGAGVFNRTRHSVATHVMEYLADVEIMVNADIFIGSFRYMAPI